jgi:hypothetical protein
MSLIDQGFKKTHKTAVIGKRFRRAGSFTSSRISLHFS